MDKWRVKLSKDWTDHCDRLTKRRLKYREDNNVPQLNGADPSPEAMLEREELGSRCECAGHLILCPVRWNQDYRRGDYDPDLGTFVDAKGVDSFDKQLIVPKLLGIERPNWAFVLIVSEHPWYTLWKWALGHDVIVPRFWKYIKEDPLRSSWWVRPHNEIMREPEELWSLLHPEII